MLDDIKAELRRIGAHDVRVSLDPEFEPETGELLKIELKGAYWHLLPEHFLELLRPVPSQAGSEAIRHAIEKRGQHVWHGPAPEGSRDTSC